MSTGPNAILTNWQRRKAFDGTLLTAVPASGSIQSGSIHLSPPNLTCNSAPLLLKTLSLRAFVLQVCHVLLIQATDLKLCAYQCWRTLGTHPQSSNRIALIKYIALTMQQTNITHLDVTYRSACWKMVSLVPKEKKTTSRLTRGFNKYSPILRFTLRQLTLLCVSLFFSPRVK